MTAPAEAERALPFEGSRMVLGVLTCLFSDITSITSWKGVESVFYRERYQISRRLGPIRGRIRIQTQVCLIPKKGRGPHTHAASLG